ncbi:MAG: hypothetical protein U5K72_02490 [Balneolaceae bacterium]|nr:hypothetical protein [Balneolaceae bacterium]
MISIHKMRAEYAITILLSVLIIVFIIQLKPVLAQLEFEEIPVEKPQVLVLSDIANEPDDQESLIR